MTLMEFFHTNKPIGYRIAIEVHWFDNNKLRHNNIFLREHRERFVHFSNIKLSDVIYYFDYEIIKKTVTKDDGGNGLHYMVLEISNDDRVLHTKYNP